MRHLLILSFFACFILVLSDIQGQSNNENLTITVDDLESKLTVTVSGLLAQKESENDSHFLPPPNVQGLNPEGVSKQQRNNLLAQNLSGEGGGNPPNNEQIQPAEPDDGSFLDNLWAMIKNNWVASVLAFMGFLKAFVNLTPSDADNKVFAWLDRLIDNIIPNLRKGGGTHPKT